MYDKSKLKLVSELKPPYRSPLAVVDAISDYIKDKVVCELGSAKCDLFPKFFPSIFEAAVLTFSRLFL